VTNNQTQTDSAELKDVTDIIKEIYRQAESLGDLLQSSGEYHQYCLARERLRQHGDYYNALVELRRNEIQLHFADLLGEDIAEDAQEFNHTYSVFCSDPIVSEFLYAEGRFSHLLIEIQNVLLKKMDLDEILLNANNNNILVN